MTAVRFVESTKYGARLFAYLLVSVAVGGVLLGLGWMLAWPEVLNALPGPPVVDRTEVAAGTVLGVLGVYVIGSGLLASINKLVADSVSRGVDTADLDVEVEVDADIESGPAETGASGPTGESTTTEMEGPAGEADSGVTGETEPPREQAEVEPVAADEEGGTSDSEPLQRRTTKVVKPSSDTAETDGASETQSPDDTGERSREPPDEPGSLDADRGDIPREPSPEEIAFGTEGSEADREGAPDDSVEFESSDDAESESETSSSVEPAGSSSSSDPLAEPTDDE